MTDISYLLVASSNTKIELLTVKALARVINCLSPTDQSDATSAISNPPLILIRFHSPTLSSADSIDSSDTLSPLGSILNRTVPGMKKGSCGITLIRERIFAHSIVERSLPSISMWPDCVSIIWRRAIIREVFPLPDGPQIATFSPALILRERVLRAGGNSGLFQDCDISHYKLRADKKKMKQTCRLQLLPQT